MTLMIRTVGAYIHCTAITTHKGDYFHSAAALSSHLADQPSPESGNGKRRADKLQWCCRCAPWGKLWRARFWLDFYSLALKFWGNLGEAERGSMQKSHSTSSYFLAAGRGTLLHSTSILESQQASWHWSLLKTHRTNLLPSIACYQ